MQDLLKSFQSISQLAIEPQARGRWRQQAALSEAAAEASADAVSDETWAQDEARAADEQVPPALDLGEPSGIVAIASPPDAAGTHQVMPHSETPAQMEVQSTPGGAHEIRASIKISDAGFSLPASIPPPSIPPAPALELLRLAQPATPEQEPGFRLPLESAEAVAAIRRKPMAHIEAVGTVGSARQPTMPRLPPAWTQSPPGPQPPELPTPAAVWRPEPLFLQLDPPLTFSPPAASGVPAEPGLPPRNLLRWKGATALIAVFSCCVISMPFVDYGMAGLEQHTARIGPSITISGKSTSNEASIEPDHGASETVVARKVAAEPKLKLAAIGPPSLAVADPRPSLVASRAAPVPNDESGVLRAPYDLRSRDASIERAVTGGRDAPGEAVPQLVQTPVLAMRPVRDVSPVPELAAPSPVPVKPELRLNPAGQGMGAANEPSNPPVVIFTVPPPTTGLAPTPSVHRRATRTTRASAPPVPVPETSAAALSGSATITSAAAATSPVQAVVVPHKPDTTYVTVLGIRLPVYSATADRSWTATFFEKQ
jgi:hypothetical protein